MRVERLDAHLRVVAADVKGWHRCLAARLMELHPHHLQVVRQRGGRASRVNALLQIHVIITLSEDRPHDALVVRVGEIGDGDGRATASSSSHGAAWGWGWRRARGAAAAGGLVGMGDGDGSATGQKCAQGEGGGMGMDGRSCEGGVRGVPGDPKFLYEICPSW